MYAVQDLYCILYAEMYIGLYVTTFRILKKYFRPCFIIDYLVPMMIKKLISVRVPTTGGIRAIDPLD